MRELVWLVIVGSTVWVGADESGRDWSGNRFADAPWKWVLGSLVLWIVTFPLYLVHRGRVPRKGGPAAPMGNALSQVASPSASVPPPTRRPCRGCGSTVGSAAHACPLCGTL